MAGHGRRVALIMGTHGGYKCLICSDFIDFKIFMKKKQLADLHQTSSQVLADNSFSSMECHVMS